MIKMIFDLPWPSEILRNVFWFIVKPNFFPKASTSLIGSTPGERIKKTGVLVLVSSKDFENGTERFSTNCLPNFSSTNKLKLDQWNFYESTKTFRFLP